MLRRLLVYKGCHVERGHPLSPLLSHIMSASSNIQLGPPCFTGDGVGDDIPTATPVDADKSGAPRSCSEARALRRRVHQYISKHPDRFHSSFPFLHATHTIFVANAASRPIEEESDTESHDGVRIFITHTFSGIKGHSWLISSLTESLASLWIDPRLLGAPPCSGIDLKVHRRMVTYALLKSLKYGRAVAIASPRSGTIHSVAQGKISHKETWQCAWCRRRLSPAIRPPHSLGIKKCFECCNG